MTKDEFLQKFKLHPLKSSTHSYLHHNQLKAAAVLIAIIDDGKQLNVLFTKRALHLRHHAGQISFPGGKTELYDASLIETAIREAKEEIGLSPNVVKVVGQLHPYQTISGFIVTPIVAFVPKDQIFTKDENEVSEIFQVPLKHFLQPKNQHTITVQVKGVSQLINFMPYKQYNIWGATASMLKDLALHLT